MQTLRAFLLIRQAQEEWAVSVHRDLESLIAAWKPFVGQESTTGVIHVGFNRPDTEAFENTAAHYPGRMLLTASARYALGMYSDCASKVAGEADHLPLYAALSGWGYTVTTDEIGLAQVNEVTFPSSQAINANKNDAREEILMSCHEDDQINWPLNTNWIQNLSSIDPRLLNVAKNVGIVDEKSYFERENLLDRKRRTMLGYSRLLILLRARDSKNPVEIARCAPPWILNLPVSSLSFSVRAENSLKIAHINRVIDLARFSLQRSLLDMPNFGKKTYRNVAKTLMAAVLHGGSSGLMTVPTSNYAITEKPSDDDKDKSVADSDLGIESTFVEILETVIKNFCKREDIIKSRMGFAGRRATLQEIGNVKDLTRQRIRQIEARDIKNLSANPLWKCTVVPKIEEMLIGRTEPLPLLGLDILDPWFCGVETIQEAFSYCLEHFCDERFSLIRSRNQIFISHLSPVEWDNAVDQGEKILKKAVGQNLQFSHVRSMIDGLLSGKGEELRPELWEVVTPLAHFSDVDNKGEPVLVTYGRGVDRLVELILADSDFPLHYTVIYRKIVERFEEDKYSARYVHASAARVGLLYGLGTYGVMKHFPISDEEADLVVAEVEDLIESGKTERQWHCNEICEELAKGGIVFEERINPYIVNIALHRSKLLAYLGRLVWTMAAARKLTTANRISVPQAIISLLREEGRPMSKQELRDKLIKVRGLSDNFQIFSQGLVFRLKQGLWGLIDRDLLLTVTEQEATLNEIEEILRQRQKGLHVTEIVGALTRTRELAERIDGIALMALAQRLKQMCVSNGQYLYLAEWGEPRRIQLIDAIRTALEQTPKGLTVQKIVEVVSTVIGRTFTSQNIYGCLSVIGAERSDKTDRWSLIVAEELNGNEENEVVTEETTQAEINHT